MNRLSFFALSLTSLMFVAAGCAKTKEEIASAKQEVQASELQHTFRQQKCNDALALKVFGASTQTDYTFSGNVVTRSEHYFSDTNCTELAGTIEYRGTFEKRDELPNDVAQVNIAYTNVSVVAANDAGKNVLSLANFCGVDEWQVNVAVDLSNRASESLCPLTDLPESIFDIYTVQGNTLLFGTAGAKTDPDHRPGELQTDDPYVQL